MWVVIGGIGEPQVEGDPPPTYQTMRAKFIRFPRSDTIEMDQSQFDSDDEERIGHNTDKEGIVAKVAGRSEESRFRRMPDIPPGNRREE